MSDQAGAPRPTSLFKWDGTIPAWGILLTGLTFALYCLNWQNDIENRTKKLETDFARYSSVVEQLVKDQSRLVQIEVEMRFIRAGIERLEGRFPSRIPSADALK